jgi:hypothetical protein
MGVIRSRRGQGLDQRIRWEDRKPIDESQVRGAIQDPPVIEKILRHIGEQTQAPEVLPARGPPQGELGFESEAEADGWPEMDQTAGRGDEGWD